jgi:predicted GIY-YIG superfamily endonuclease
MVQPVYYAYILRCADDSFYLGSAQDLDSRVKAHNNGRGAAHTFKDRPVQLVYSEAFESETAAVSKERQLKRWSHGKKQSGGNMRRLKRLSKRRLSVTPRRK